MFSPARPHPLIGKGLRHGCRLARTKTPAIVGHLIGRVDAYPFAGFRRCRHFLTGPLAHSAGSEVAGVCAARAGSAHKGHSQLVGLNAAHPARPTETVTVPPVIVVAMDAFTYRTSAFVTVTAVVVAALVVLMALPKA